MKKKEQKKNKKRQPNEWLPEDTEKLYKWLKFNGQVK